MATSLSPAQLETLHTFVYRDAFDADDLFRSIRFKLGEDMYKEWVPTGLPFKESVFRLILKLQEVGMIIPFIDMVLEVRATRSGIEAIQAVRDALNAPTPTVSDQTAAIKTSLDGVAGKMQIAAVREILMKSRGVLTELTGRIELLRSYKGLHDALHTAKMQFRSLETSAKQMAADPMAAGDFSQAVMSMETLATSMTGIIQELPADPASIRQDENDWMVRFSSAVALAQSAADSGDQILARQGAQGVRTILRTEPSRIDGKLSRTADEIDLAKLKDVFAAASGVPELSEEAPALGQGHTATEQLLRQLKAQINQHGDWQDIDRSLSGADDIMRMLTPEEPWDFDALWKGLKEGVNNLITVEPQSAWAKKISAVTEKVDASRSAGDWARLPMDFTRFRQEATVQFFVVDTKLKTLAGEVNVIGAPLRNLLNNL